jgi:mutator protein MutT
MDERRIQSNGTQVVAAVIRRDNLYLLCQRPEGKRHSLLWEFPGGKVEPGESIFEATKRELAEELGVTAMGVGTVLLSSVDPASGYSINFVDVTIAGEPHAIEHADLKWVSLPEARNLLLAPSDRAFVEHMTRLE